MNPKLGSAQDDKTAEVNLGNPNISVPPTHRKR